jgi:hypothetical protein
MPTPTKAKGGEGKARVLVACEFSGVVRRALRDIGIDAWSCDLLPAEDGDPHHFRCDWREAYAEFQPSDVYAFPPCTDLCVSGARHFAAKRASGQQQASIEFFLEFTRLDCRWCIENPIGIMSTLYRKPDQIIQPWQFGHGETKATCLWLNGLPLLKPTNIVEGRETRIHKMAPSPHRAKERSRTYEGIAKAMAEQFTTPNPSRP